MKGNLDQPGKLAIESSRLQRLAFLAALRRGDPFVLLGIWLGNRPALTRLSEGLPQAVRALFIALKGFGA